MAKQSSRGLIIVALFFLLGVFLTMYRLKNNLVSLTRDSYEVPAQGTNGTSSYNVSFHSKDCKTDDDCILIQDKICKTFGVVNKKYKNWWREQNKREFATSHTCKLVEPGDWEIKNFKAHCNEKLQCEVQFL